MPSACARRRRPRSASSLSARWTIFLLSCPRRRASTLFANRCVDSRLRGNDMRWSGLRDRAPARAAVRGHEIDLRTARDDAARVQLAMAAVIMPADMVEIHGLGHARHLVQLARIRPQVRIFDQLPAVALEVAVIHGVE